MDGIFVCASPQPDRLISLTDNMSAVHALWHWPDKVVLRSELGSLAVIIKDWSM